MQSKWFCSALLTFAVGCQLSTASFTRHFGGGGDEPAARPLAPMTSPDQPPPHTSVYEGGPVPASEREAPATVASAPAPEAPEPPVSREPERLRVDLRAGESAPAGAETTCRVSGRSAMCGGVCTDVQVDDNHCGQCNDACDAGSHCDYGTCRDASGKPT